MKAVEDAAAAAAAAAAALNETTAVWVDVNKLFSIVITELTM